MITFIAHLHVKPENAAEFEALLADVGAQTRAKEPGVVYYEFARSVDEADTYVMIEVYRDVASQAAHMASDWVRSSLPGSAALIEGKPRVSQYVTPGEEPLRQRMF
jgi:quinol monooxygenase YgiN